METVAERMHVKQRQRQQESIPLLNLPARKQVHRVDCEIVVREDRAFRRPRRAGCVDQGRRRVAVKFL